MRKNNRTTKMSITKYDPIFRNELGHYVKKEWTSFSDIGKMYEGNHFTFEEYEKVERKYIESVYEILDYYGSNRVKIQHIFKLDTEKDFNTFDSKLLFSTYEKAGRGQMIKGNEAIGDLVKLRLREHIAELDILVHTKSKTELLFGFDYYMYLKTNQEVSLLLKRIRDIGLFIF